MKAQDAYNVLNEFLIKHNAGLAEKEALKSLAAFVKAVQTKENKQRNNASYQMQIDQFSPTSVAPPKASTHKNGSMRAKGKAWTAEEEQRLKEEYRASLDGYQMASLHGRTVEAVAARLQSLGVIDSRDELPGYAEYRDKIARQRGGRYYPGQYSKNKK